jgi:hypothetical protein
MNSILWFSPSEEEVDNEEWKLGVESGKLPDSDHAAHGVSYQEALQVRVLRLRQKVLKKTKREVRRRDVQQCTHPSTIWGKTKVSLFKSFISLFEGIILEMQKK